jgi:multidrug efflux pump subunit AcrA (membrane-fusion protein)
VVVEGGRMHIFVVEDGKASRRIVSLGKRELGRVEITDGLAEGEKVVARGVQSLRDGAPVKAIGDGAGAGEAAPEAGAERQVRG